VRYTFFRLSVLIAWGVLCLFAALKGLPDAAIHGVADVVAFFLAVWWGGAFLLKVTGEIGWSLSRVAMRRADERREQLAQDVAEIVKRQRGRGRR
jgi:hypothetical protein